MTTDPISTPALTPFELFEALKAKGYQPRPCHQHSERGYCCAQAVADASEDFQDDPAAACEVMKRFLEIDRREVFRVWYGEDKEKKFGEMWFAKLKDANEDYIWGKIDTCIDHILQHR